MSFNACARVACKAMGAVALLFGLAMALGSLIGARDAWSWALSAVTIGAVLVVLGDALFPARDDGA